MATYTRIAPWRARLCIGKNILRLLGTPNPRGNLPERLTDRMARDIGMTKGQLEQHRFTLPSRSLDRPWL